AAQRLLANEAELEDDIGQATADGDLIVHGGLELRLREEPPLEELGSELRVRKLAYVQRFTHRFPRTPWSPEARSPPASREHPRRAEDRDRPAARAPPGNAGSGRWHLPGSRRPGTARRSSSSEACFARESRTGVAPPSASGPRAR